MLFIRKASRQCLQGQLGVLFAMAINTPGSACLCSSNLSNCATVSMVSTNLAFVWRWNQGTGCWHTSNPHKQLLLLTNPRLDSDDHLTYSDGVWQVL
jgi:hypothetical protein